MSVILCAYFAELFTHNLTRSTNPVKGFPTLLYVPRSTDGALDWEKPGERPNVVPNDKNNIHDWLRLDSSLGFKQPMLSHPFEVRYKATDTLAPQSIHHRRVEIRVQGMLENANLHPKGERRRWSYQIFIAVLIANIKDSSFSFTVVTAAMASSTFNGCGWAVTHQGSGSGLATKFVFSAT